MSTPTDPLDQPIQWQRFDEVINGQVISFGIPKNSRAGRVSTVTKVLPVADWKSPGLSGALQSTDKEHAISPSPPPQKNLHPLSVNFTEYAPGPITHLPVEMLMEIFKYATCARGVDILNVLDPSSMPHSISRVCHRWRAVAIENCPKIWSNFSLDWNLSHWDYKNDPVALLSLVLSRSGKEPLVFLLSDEEDLLNEDENPMIRDAAVTEELIRVLVEQCYRWQEVSISIPATFFHLLSPIRGRLHALVKFEFNETFIEEFRLARRLPRNRIVSNILDGAPLLETLTLSSSFGIWRPRIAIIPRMCPKFSSFSDLREAAVSDALHQHFLDIVGSIPGITKFDVRLTGFFPIADPRIVNTSITELSVCSGSFLRSVILPNLKEVHLQCPAPALRLYYLHDGVASLYDLITHSGCSLTSLTTDCALNKRLISILQASPEIVTLSLSLSSWLGDSMPTILSLIAELGKAEPAFLPKLQDFSLHLPAGTSLFPEMEPLCMKWVDSIEHRWSRKGSNLRSVGFEVGNFPREDTEGGFTFTHAFCGRLAKMEMEGLSVLVLPGSLY